MQADKEDSQQRIDNLKQRSELLEKRLAKIKLDITTAYPADLNDQAQERENDEVLDQIGENTRSELLLVHRALQRHEQGEYGTCLRCQQPIDDARLDAIPEAEFCIACA